MVGHTSSYVRFEVFFATSFALLNSYFSTITLLFFGAIRTTITMSSASEILAVIIDCDVGSWTSSPKSFVDFLNSLLFYLNAFVALQSNQIIVYANQTCIYNSITSFSYAFNTIIRETILEVIQQSNNEKISNGYLTSALSKALCGKTYTIFSIINITLVHFLSLFLHFSFESTK